MLVGLFCFALSDMGEAARRRRVAEGNEEMSIAAPSSSISKLARAPTTLGRRMSTMANLKQMAQARGRWELVFRRNADLLETQTTGCSPVLLITRSCPIRDRATWFCLAKGKVGLVPI